MNNISKYILAGINYTNTDTARLGQFAIGNDQYVSLLRKAHTFGIKDFFVLSTCNRTEIYGFAEVVSQLTGLLCTETSGNPETFLQLAYIKTGAEAVGHLFEVAAGLNSRILGDYEIVGQIKTAVAISRQYGCIGTFQERLINSVLQSSKAIKNQTLLSAGTVSVSFASVQYIKQHVKNISNKKILLIGTGKIGRTTCKNIIQHLHTTNITLINRSVNKAIVLGKELNLHHKSMHELPDLIGEHDILIVATNASDPFIRASYLKGSGWKLIIDLSMPSNVEQAASCLSNVSIVTIDEISKITDDTLERRQVEIPKSKAIISGHIREFMEWYEMRKHVPILNAVKSKLIDIVKSRTYIDLYSDSLKNNPEEKIQNSLNRLLMKIKTQNKYGCHFIETISEFMATGIS